MFSHRKSLVRLMLCSSAFVGSLASADAAMAQDVPILQPGAPGQPSTVLRPEEAARIADNRYTADDVRFMQQMIHHHHQAVLMAQLVGSRTNSQAVTDAARRIQASQADEIAFMQGWLRERGQTAPDPAAAGAHAGHGAHGAGQDHMAMRGMATAAQMAALAAARGSAFERLWLERMIAHHEGALEMGRDLLGRPGSAYDPVLAEFVNDLINEQQGEISQMVTALAALSEDPRTSLAAGFDDAGQAISNMRLIASLPKPTGFFDPANPVGLPPAVPAAQAAAGAAPPSPDEASGRFGDRSPQLSFANTDMAFAGDLLAVGSYHGFNLYRLGGEQPRLLSSVICPGGQGDVSIVGNLLIMSVEQTTARVDCGREGVTEQVSRERFRGIRIFDIANPARPVQVGQVQTCRGSHTHSVVSGPGQDGNIIVYVSGTAGVRSEEELPGCVAAIAGDQRTALFRIDVIEIPAADPSRARIIDSPAVFADVETGQLSGLWRGGDHGARNFGIQVDGDAPAPAPAAAAVSLSKVALEKPGQSVSLEKGGASFGEIVVNLNWSRGNKDAVDLDLSCLWELADGSFSVVQAIGRRFGDYAGPPYILLEADDRTGDAGQGEIMRINGGRWKEIKRIAVYAIIYHGVPNWSATDGVVTVTIPNQPPIEVRLTDGHDDRRICGIVLLENDGGALKATRIVRYYERAEELDADFNWGLTWTMQSKD